MRLKALKRKIEPKNKLVAFRVNPNEYVKLKEIAEKYTDGNVAAWVRFASTNFKPLKKHLTSDS